MSVISHLVGEWRGANIQDGDTLLIHSGIRRLRRRLASLGYEITPNILLESLLAALGERGTLILPLFNFGFTTGIAFDIRTTPSQMGSLTEAGRHWPGAVRTGHPIYSFVAIGVNARAFLGVENFSGYGYDSPFGMLHRMDGRIAIIDLPDQNSMTFYHYVEEQLNVDYRYHKIFEGMHSNYGESPKRKEFGLFVRDIEKNIQTHVNPMGELLWERCLYSGDRPGVNTGIRSIRAGSLFDAVSETIVDGKALGLLYRS